MYAHYKLAGDAFRACIVAEYKSAERLFLPTAADTDDC